MKKLFQLLSGIVAVIPGIAILTDGFLTPPNQRLLFALALEVFGVGALLVLVINSRVIENMTRQIATTLGICLFALVFLLLVSHYALFSHCVISPTDPRWVDHGPVYFPIMLQGDLKEDTLEVGSRVALVDEFSPGEIKSRIAEAHGQLTGTTTILLVVYTAFIVALTSVFAILGIRAKGEPLVRWLQRNRAAGDSENIDAGADNEGPSDGT